MGNQEAEASSAADGGVVAAAAATDAATDAAVSDAALADPKRRASAAQVLRQIFMSFSSAREERKGSAYRQLQRDLSAHADVLILSGQITLPQIIDTMQKMEEYLGSGEHEDSGEDASTTVMRWLNGEEAASSDEFTEGNSEGRLGGSNTNAAS